MFEGVVQLTERVAQACLQADVRLVHVGTCEEYGDGPCPFYEDQLPQPVSPYSTAKVAATLRVLALHRTRGLRVTVARPFLTYGPGQTGDRLIPAAIRAALGGTPFAMTEGRQTREVNYVEDTVAVEPLNGIAQRGERGVQRLRAAACSRRCSACMTTRHRHCAASKFRWRCLARSVV